MRPSSIHGCRRRILGRRAASPSVAIMQRTSQFRAIVQAQILADSVQGSDHCQVQTDGAGLGTGYSVVQSVMEGACSWQCGEARCVAIQE